MMEKVKSEEQKRRKFTYKIKLNMMKIEKGHRRGRDNITSLCISLSMRVCLCVYLSYWLQCIVTISTITCHIYMPLYPEVHILCVTDWLVRTLWCGPYFSLQLFGALSKLIKWTLYTYSHKKFVGKIVIATYFYFVRKHTVNLT